ncbi:hypothetical protein CCUS01_07248 [Colletotrichum cuscutae]|uniref:LysM domain-containing protein n=1 Tax=Colletotrichum cuscutae TaxID=1209917 RepID=A0AAI9V2T4_9PEZI|nr:hypothetical protein CCUS01_07248 [Colletotrichum cuscutae]
MNVKILGVKGDGKTDDTSALNSILQGAANTSSVVFFPYGVYLVTDTLRVPVGSRIIGQVWPQIMGIGDKFSDETQPRAVVEVGKAGDVGIVEIISMMVTVKGPTAGAVTIEWNVAESSTGSAGMWAPTPFTTGLFPNDPTFSGCVASSSATCAVSWAVRIIDSSSIYMLGAGLYSWFIDYSQDCLDTENSIVEMVSPLGSVLTYAKDNLNGFLASVLAWLQGSTDVAGEREFEGYCVWTSGMLEQLYGLVLLETCSSALTEIIDTDSGKYCGEIIDGFTTVSTIEEMPKNELCSFCWSQYEYTVTECGIAGVNTTIPETLLIIEDPSNSVSLATLSFENLDTIFDCFNIEAGSKLCIPLPCTLTWVIQPDDTCASIEYNLNMTAVTPVLGNTQKYNRWVDKNCENLHIASAATFGHVLCMSPPDGAYTGNDTVNGDTTTPTNAPGYSEEIIDPPAGATVADGTTVYCGSWHVAAVNDTCSTIAFSSGTTITLFLEVNPSLGTEVAGCTKKLVQGNAYCGLPFVVWDELDGSW